MSSYIYTIRAENKTIKNSSTDEKINIRLAKFFCRNQSLDNNTIDSINYRYLKKGVAPYIVLGDDLKDLSNQKVFEYNSEDGHLNDQHDLGKKYNAIGVILGKPRAWLIETRKDVIEKLHRQNEYQQMRQRKLSIGKFGYDYNLYEEFLHSKDKEAQANGEDFYFRGYSVI